MVDIRQGDVWWAELPDASGSGPGFRRPVVVVQSDALNRSRVKTAVCVPMTSNTTWGNAPGNVLLTKDDTGLSKTSIANASQILAIDRALLIEHVGVLPERKLAQILQGIALILAR